MNPFIEAQRLYKGRGKVFEQDLGIYHAHGFVFSTPERILLGRPVKQSPDEWLPVSRFNEADTWYVHFVIGKDALRWALRMMPWPLPKLCWRRDFVNSRLGLRHFHTNRLLSLAEINT